MTTKVGRKTGGMMDCGSPRVKQELVNDPIIPGIEIIFRWIQLEISKFPYMFVENKN